MTLKSLLVGVAISVGLTIFGGIIAPQQTSAMGIAHCAGVNGSGLGTGLFKDSGTRQIDPIVSRGSEMSMHDHQFFGFTEWESLTTPQRANYQDLVGKTTSCDIVGDSAAYWTPTMRYKSGAKNLVTIKRQEAYYRSWDGKLTDTLKATQTFPADLRMVAGNPMAMSSMDRDPKVVSWSCGNLSTKAQRTGTNKATPIEANCATARNYNNATKNDRVFLTVAVKFPTCWDGKLNNHTIDGDTTDFSGSKMPANVQHVAYRVGTKCPTGFPYKIPELTIVTSWDYRSTGKDITLSSGMGMAAGQGFTYHADFWNTWEPTALQNMINTCINTTETDAVVHVSYPDVCGPTVIMTPPGAKN